MKVFKSEKFYISLTAIILFLFLVLGLANCFGCFENEDELEYISLGNHEYYVSILPTNEEECEKLAQDIVNDNLSRYLSDYNPRLKDFKIREIKRAKVSEDSSQFTFEVYFDVLPTFSSHASWIPGNGVDGSGGWITHKYLMFEYSIENNHFICKNTATGP